MSGSCPDGCDNGWQYTTAAHDVVRPCESCRPQDYARWRAGYRGRGKAAQRVDRPTQHAPDPDQDWSHTRKDLE